MTKLWGTDMDPRAAPPTIDWMQGTRTMAEVMADEAAPAPTLEDIAWEHIALLQLLAQVTGQPTAFCPRIAAAGRALGLSGSP